MNKEQFIITMPDGSSFRCIEQDKYFPGRKCSCNVFTKDEKGKYVCNACKTKYVGEK